MSKKRALKSYNIPVVWQSWGLLTIEAESLEDAIAEATAPGTSLPLTSEYVDGSFEVDRDGILMHNDDLTDFEKEMS